MFTAQDAKALQQNDLDERIEYAVKHRRQDDGAYLRVYSSDWFAHSIERELSNRGFVNIQAPSFVLSGDVYFEWE